MITKNQTGDTIVEVLLAIAVVSSVLGGAYVAANRSLNTNRAAQERTEAAKLVESQIERLKVATSNAAIFNDNVYCLDAGLVPHEFSGPIAVMPAVAADNTVIYPAECVINNGVAYSVSVDKENGTNNFTVRVRWDRAGTGTREEAEIVYRVYQ